MSIYVAQFINPDDRGGDNYCVLERGDFGRTRRGDISDYSTVNEDVDNGRDCVSERGMCMVKLKTHINPIPYGLFNKPNLMGGGRSAPPCYMAIGEYSY